MYMFSCSYVSAGCLFINHDYVGTARELSVPYHIMILLQLPGKTSWWNIICQSSFAESLETSFI